MCVCIYIHTHVSQDVLPKGVILHSKNKNTTQNYSSGFVTTNADLTHARDYSSQPRKIQKTIATVKKISGKSATSSTH